MAMVEYDSTHKSLLSAHEYSHAQISTIVQSWVHNNEFMTDEGKKEYAVLLSEITHHAKNSIARADARELPRYRQQANDIIDILCQMPGYMHLVHQLIITISTIRNLINFRIHSAQQPLHSYFLAHQEG
jgi:hypothetical protein